MGTISVRVEDDLKEMAEGAAAAQGLSVSEWTRNVVRAQLGLDIPERAGPVSLSKRERQQLVMLHRLLQRTTDDADEQESHQARVEVLEHGFTTEYASSYDSIYDELPISECRLVFDLLEMFTVLERSVEVIGIEALKKHDDHAEYALRFHGFDFNDAREGRLADFADYVVRHGRWSSMAVYFDDKHERGNSHMPALDSYLRMLEVFKPIWHDLVHGRSRGRYDLTEQELVDVMQARYYPG